MPVNLRFTNEKVDLGIPGEEGLGGRFCRKLEVLPATPTVTAATPVAAQDEQPQQQKFVSFIGSKGEVDVAIQDGGWATLPIRNQKMDAGERKLRFFLDFPQGARRDDVSIPAGRVFFSTAAIPPQPATAAAASSPSLSSSLSNTGYTNTNTNTNVITSPNGSGILTEGGVTIKSNGGILNLYGAAGDINLILGRFSVRQLR